MLLKQYFIDLISHYGYIGILIGLALEYTGLPVPGETMMSFLGYLVSRNSGLSSTVSTIYSAAGTFTGSFLAYFIGFRYGENVILKFGRKFGISQENLDKVKRLFTKRQVLLLLFGRYVPGVRHLVPYVSGISRIKPVRFLIFNLIGSLLWCASFIGLGYILGDRWSSVERLAKSYILIIILLAAFAFIVFRYFNKHKSIIFAVTLPVLLFIKLCEDVIRDELSVFDSKIYGYLSNLIGHNVTIAMRTITYLGSWQILVSITLLIYIFLAKYGKPVFFAHFTAINLISVSLLSEMFKFVFHRDRPDILRLTNVIGYSFPSGHSMVGLCFYGLLAYFCFIYVKSRWKYAAITVLCLIVGLIGVSRIYLGVHYASDVLAGFSAGMAWLVVYIVVMNKYMIPLLNGRTSGLEKTNPDGDI